MIFLKNKAKIAEICMIIIYAELFNDIFIRKITFLMIRILFLLMSGRCEKVAQQSCSAMLHFLQYEWFDAHAS